MNDQIAIQNLLRRKLSEAQTKNPMYSLRAFAGRLNLNAGALSGIINGKRMVSKKLARKLSDALMLDPKEKTELLKLFPLKQRYAKQSSILNDEVDSTYLEISASQFRVIAEWQHYAILSLINVKGFKSDENWIAARLGISVNKTKQALERLLNIGMLEMDKEGTIRRVSSYLTTTDGISDISLKKAHEESLEMAKLSLHEDPVEIRDHSSMTMAIDRKKIKEAKKLIRDFQDKLVRFLEDGEKTDVYRFSTHLFPLTKY